MAKLVIHHYNIHKDNFSIIETEEVAETAKTYKFTSPGLPYVRYRSMIKKSEIGKLLFGLPWQRQLYMVDTVPNMGTFHKLVVGHLKKDMDAKKAEYDKALSAYEAALVCNISTESCK